MPAPQTTHTEAPAAENVPAAHVRHADAPGDGWYDPAKQPVQPLDPAAE